MSHPSRTQLAKESSGGGCVTKLVDRESTGTKLV